MTSPKLYGARRRKVETFASQAQRSAAWYSAVARGDTDVPTLFGGRSSASPDARAHAARQASSWYQAARDRLDRLLRP